MTAPRLLALAPLSPRLDSVRPLPDCLYANEFRRVQGGAMDLRPRAVDKAVAVLDGALDRALGALYGLAIGDALGMPTRPALLALRARAP